MPNESQHHSIKTYLLAYLLWIVSMGLGLAAMYMIRQTYTLSLITPVMTNPNLTETQKFYNSLSARAADQWSLFIVGILLIPLLVFLEYLYRSSVPTGQLWYHFTLVTAIELGTLFLATAIFTYLQMQIQSFLWAYLLILAVEAIVAGLSWRLWLNLKRKATA